MASRLQRLRSIPLLILLAATGCNADGGPSVAPPQAACEAARLFSREPLVEFTGVDKSTWRHRWVFVSGKDRIEVDVSTNEVTEVIYSYPARESTAPGMSIDEAEGYMRTWLRGHGRKLDGWILAGRRKLQRDVTGSIYEYAFDWEKRSPNGVRLPSALAATMHPDGRVVSYMYVERPVQVELEPTLTLDEAVKIAASANKLSTSDRLNEADLTVWFDDTGAQRLEWVVTLSDSPKSQGSVGLVSSLTRDYGSAIDAQSGEVLWTDVSLGPGTQDKADPDILNKAKKVAKCLSRADRIDLFAPSTSMRKHSGLADPHTIPSTAWRSAKVEPHDTRVVKLRSEMVSSLQKPTAFPALQTSSVWLRVHVAGASVIYYCRCSRGYFGVCWKEPSAGKSRRDTRELLWGRWRPQSVNVGSRMTPGLAEAIGELVPDAARYCVVGSK